MRKTIGLFGSLLVLSAWVATACHSKDESGLPQAPLTIDGHAIQVEVANQEATRMTGLMFRRDMDRDHGMVFVFPDSQIRAFWMKNTFIPLSIAYMDDRGVILNILEMPPQTEDAFYSDGQAKYALEMNTGWYKAHGVKAGDRVEGLAAVPTAVP